MESQFSHPWDEMVVPKLDTREARTDLTSRECTKLFWMSICALLQVGHTVTGIRKTLSVLTKIYNREDVADADLKGVDRLANKALSGAIAVLEQMAPPENVKVAVQWWAECDEAWDMAHEKIPGLTSGSSDDLKN